LIFEVLASLKIAYTAEGGKPEIGCKSLKRMVGERAFEPPTPFVRLKHTLRKDPNQREGAGVSLRVK